jgi:hypothetical protein
VIAIIAAVLVIISAFAFGYYTGRDKARDDAAIEKYKRSKQMNSVRDKIVEDLTWRGPNDKVMGHVVLSRDQAEEVLGFLTPFKWTCGHEGGAVCAECHRELAARANQLAEENMRLSEQCEGLAKSAMNDGQSLLGLMVTTLPTYTKLLLMEGAIRATASQGTYDEAAIRKTVSFELAELIVDAHRGGEKNG